MIKDKIRKILNLRYLWRVQKMDTTVFFRDDDVDALDTSIIKLVTLFLRYNTSLSLQVIPNKVDEKFVEYFSNIGNESLFDIGQHGFSHAKYYTNKIHQGEFGRNRTIDEKRNDIKNGKIILQKHFGDSFINIFTPPYNSMDEKTFSILKEEGFKAFSVASEKNISKYKHILNIKRDDMFDLSESVDFIKNWDTIPRSKTSDELIQDFEKARKEFPIVGIMLHDKKMNTTDFETLEKFMMYLKEKNIKIKKMGDILKDLS